MGAGPCAARMPYAVVTESVRIALKLLELEAMLGGKRRRCLLAVEKDGREWAVRFARRAGGRRKCVPQVFGWVGER